MKRETTQQKRGTEGPSRLYRWRGALLIAFIQAAPLAVTQDGAGGLSLGIGFGTADYRQILSSCANPTITRDVDVRTFTALIDYLFPSEKGRISAFGGTMNAKFGPSADPGVFRNPPDGFFMGAIGGVDTRDLAAQLGMLMLPNHEDGRRVRFAAHGRIGRREGFHLRGDLNTVRSPGQIPSSMVGLGFGSAAAGNSILIGIAELPLADVGYDPSATTVAGVIEGSVKLSKTFTLTAGTTRNDDLEAWYAGMRIGARARK